MSQKYETLNVSLGRAVLSYVLHIMGRRAGWIDRCGGGGVSIFGLANRRKTESVSSSFVLPNSSKKIDDSGARQAAVGLTILAQGDQESRKRGISLLPLLPNVFKIDDITKELLNLNKKYTFENSRNLCQEGGRVMLSLSPKNILLTAAATPFLVGF